MDRILATKYLIEGDLDSVYNNLHAFDLTLSEIFIKCIDYAYGIELDSIISKCLLLNRQYVSYMIGETDVDYRERAKLYAPVLDVFIRKNRHLPAEPEDDTLMDNWANRNDFGAKTLSKKNCSHSYSMYHGLAESYEYCTLCNEKKS